MAGLGSSIGSFIGRKAALALGSSIGALCLAPAAAAAQEVQAEAEGEAGAIVVTGSRIAADGMKAPVPVTVLQADEVEALSPGALINGVSQMPQFSNNATLNGGGTVFTRASYGALNLRGLGVNRTLTLLNGRRVPSSSAFGGVDINLFPEAMIQAVETTTGGASAAYGSDAVAGVVNFKLDTRFTGIELAAQANVTSRGDNPGYEVSGAYGTAFGGDRGHVLVSAEYRREDGIFTLAGRDWYQGWGTVGTGTQADPYRFVPGVFSANGSFDGIIHAPGTAIDRLQFDPDGNVAPFVPGAILQGGTGLSGARTTGGSADDFNADIYPLTPDAERVSAFAYADYEFGDGAKVFAQYMFGQNKVFTRDRSGSLIAGLGPGGAGGPGTVTIFSGNPYLPASVQALMTANNIGSFLLRRRGHSSDIGNGYFQDDTSQHIATAGLNVKLGSSWGIDGFYQYGTSRRNWAQGSIRLDRIYAALDAVVDPATGNTVCRVSLTAAGAAAFPGCVPLNLFGRGNASAAAVDYVTNGEPGVQVTTPLFFADDGYASGQSYSYTSGATKLNVTDFKQHYAELVASGDLFDLGAGAAKVAVGASYRRDSILQRVQDPTNLTSNHTLPVSLRLDPAGNPLPAVVLANNPALNLRGVGGADATNTVGFQFSKVSNIKGYSEVWEGFGEVLLPLIDTGGFSAVANGAVRFADYSQSGGIWAYKGGLELGFLGDQLRLRGTYSRDVRAGNLSERFDVTGGAGSVVTPAVPNAPAGGAVTIFSGGNPAVQPEKADTFTVGGVFRPDFIPGLSLSLDYYDIKIRDAISRVGTQGVVDRCFVSQAQEFCDLITLSTGPATPTSTGGTILIVGDIFVNVAESRVRGLDLEASYVSDVTLFGGDESIALRGFAAWLLERSDTDSSGFKQDLAGQTGARQTDATYFTYADFRANAALSYRNGGFSALLQGRYIGSGLQDACAEAGRCQSAADPRATNPLRYVADNRVDDVLYLDLRLGYRLEHAGRTFEIFGTVSNLTDAAPPLTPSFTSFFGWSTQHNQSVYDVLGRRYTVGVKIKM